jgi:oligoendopeptidase F
MKIKTDWDLNPLFSGPHDPKLAEAEKRASTQVELFAKHWQDRDDWLKNPLILKEALDAYERLILNFGFDSVRGYYFFLAAELDQSDPVLKARLAQTRHLSQKLINQSQFFTHRLAKVDKTTQKEFLSHPDLKIYQHFLERLFAEAKYLLSEEEEKILNLHSGVAYGNWIQLLENSLAKEERLIQGQTKALTEIMSLVNDSNKSLRDEAAQALNEIVSSKVEIAEAELNAILENKKISDELRGTNRPDELRLLSDDMETETVDSMLEAVSEAFPIAHEFYQLKAKLLGQKKLGYYEKNVAWGAIDQTYKFEEACAITNKVLAKLDPEFSAIFEAFVSQGQIDVYPKKNKSSGAFCAHETATAPTYIMLNYNGKINDITTLAHETGHGINNELMRKTRHALDFDSPVSTAEVASTLIEDFVLEELRNGVDDKTQLALLMTKLNDDISTIFRQVAAYRFEQALHQEFRQTGFIPATKIGQIFKDHMQAYLGPSIDMGPGTENGWIYWSHFRRYFYVYSYASGLLISKNLQQKLRADKKFIVQVKKFLAAGTSASPKKIFSDLGLDISSASFWQDSLTQIRTDLDLAKNLAKQYLA